MTFPEVNSRQVLEAVVGLQKTQFETIQHGVKSGVVKPEQPFAKVDWTQ